MTSAHLGGTWTGELQITICFAPDFQIRSISHPNFCRLQCGDVAGTEQEEI